MSALCVVVVVVVALSAAAASATPLQDCDADMTGFELVTGYVFTAPDDLLDSIPGTLMLTDCLEACHANDTCYSVNYETGLCVMFSSNADAYPGKRHATVRPPKGPVHVRFVASAAARRESLTFHTARSRCRV